MPVVHDPMDYFCQPTLITKLCEFLHILACASGLAATSSDGYTFVTLGEWYNSHLERAHRCPDITAVRVWLERSVRGFKSALLAIKMRLRAILYSPAFERPFDTFVLSFDAECFSELRSAEVTQENLADRLAELEQYHGSTSSGPALQSMTLPLLSALVKTPGKPKGPMTKKQKLSEGPLRRLRLAASLQARWSPPPSSSTTASGSSPPGASGSSMPSQRTSASRSRAPAGRSYSPAAPMRTGRRGAHPGARRTTSPPSPLPTRSSSSQASPST